jgi:hypothetical protein
MQRIEREKQRQGIATKARFLIAGYNLRIGYFRFRGLKAFLAESVEKKARRRRFTFPKNQSFSAAARQIILIKA